MAPLRALIVDDEPAGRSCVRHALGHVADIEIVGECCNGIEAVEAIPRLEPDIVFLDIQMPGVDGFEVVEQVGIERMPPVLFVTAYDEYAVRAFEMHAMDYVLKPFTDARFVDAVEHARARLAARPSAPLAEGLAALLEGRVPHGGARQPYISRVAIRHHGAVRFVPVGNVDYFEVERNYVRLHVGPATFTVRSTLRHLAERLDPTRFVRIHRSTIVNLARVTEVQPWFGGDHLAILHDGRKLKVSRTHRADLLRTFR